MLIMHNSRYYITIVYSYNLTVTDWFSVSTVSGSRPRIIFSRLCENVYNNSENN